jgi:hypothetical protein
MKNPTFKNLTTFAILTATVEAWGAHDSEKNIAHNALLEKHLTSEGYQFDKVTGYYKGVNQGVSFFLPHISKKEALELAAAYLQESIIANEGLVYTATGRVVPALDTLFGARAKATGNYTEFDDGSAFAFELTPE